MNKAQAHPENEKRPEKTAPEPDSCLTPAAINDRLDEELDQSFPASDPPSFVRDPPDMCERKEKSPKDTSR